MRDFVIRRLLQGLLTLWIVSMVIFLLVRVSGDPTFLLLEIGAPQSEVEAMRVKLGLDKPLVVQYGIFIGNIFRGDFGMSQIFHQSCLELYLDRLPATIQLVAVGASLAFSIGIVLGVLSALKVGGFVDTFGKGFAFLGLAIPGFWLGLMLIMVFSVYLRVLPTSGRGGIDHLIMPSICLGFHMCAAYLRLSRSSLLEVLGSDFIRFARIKGLTEILVVGKHALKNASIPILTYAGIQLVHILNGVVVIEVVFGWPGTGRLLYQAIWARDYALMQTITLITAVMMIGMSLVVDILYAYIDPRIRLG
ncbi:ABC transporter permease [Chloroflexota bacterium]